MSIYGVGGSLCFERVGCAFYIEQWIFCREQFHLHHLVGLSRARERKSVTASESGGVYSSSKCLQPAGEAAGFSTAYNCIAAELVSLCWERVS